MSFKLHGINYSPRKGPDWAKDKCKSQRDIELDMKTLVKYTNRVRIFSLTDCNAAEMVLKATRPLGMKVWIGMWIGEDNSNFNAELSRLKYLIQQGWITSQVVGLHVGSETLYRKDITLHRAIKNYKIVQRVLSKTNVKIPVTIADLLGLYYVHPVLFDTVEVISANAFPFWEKVDAKDGLDRLMDSSREMLLKVKETNKSFVLSETGWASGGFNGQASIATKQGQGIFFKDFICSKTAQKLDYYYFSSFDDEWKRDPKDKEDTVEAHFGLFFANRTLKPWIASLNLDCQRIAMPMDPIPVAPDISIGSAAETSFSFSLILALLYLL